MKICAATGNAGKLRELRRILEAQGHEVVSQKQLGITIEPEETGTTFAENALIKAETICKACGLPTIADDSGLCVDALGGAPGVYSARYCGRHGDDEANNDKLLDVMQAVPAGQRGAKFVSAVCFILPDGRHLTCMGECPGSIAFERLCGDYGFGYDPLFIPADCGVGKHDKRPNTEGRSYAQLTPDEKDAISHRGVALAKLEKLPLESLIDHSFGSLFANMDAKWLGSYERAVLYGEMLEIFDYSPEVDTYLKVTCFPTFAGYCGCILFNVQDFAEAHTLTDSEKAMIMYLGISLGRNR